MVPSFEGKMHPPHHQSPYLLSATEGRNVKLGRFKAECSHTSLLTFMDKEDLQYYLEKDPADVELKAWSGDGSVVKLGVADVASGVI